MSLIPHFVFLLISTPLLAADRPNIIVMMADDLGYENLSCNGSTIYQTPNLDKLAAGGLRLENFHAQPICTPSRVQIMTGIHNNRNYIKFGLLDPAAITFGNLMRDSGYDTCVAGKWQLGGGFEGVKSFGFDHHCLWQLTRRPSRYPNPGLEIDGAERDFKNGEFGPHVVSKYVCDFIGARKDGDKPFFIYYPMIAPHWPFVPTPGSPDWDPAMWRDAKNEPGGWRDQKYWSGMVKLTDEIVGAVVAKLEEVGLREKTLLIFTGDNGTYTGIHHEFQGRQMDGGKGSTKDNGTHVPFIASWPGTITAGKVCKELADLTDILPTVVGLAGGKVPDGIDGRSLEGLFKGDSGYQARDYLYCWYQRDGVREQASQHVRDVRYKLYSDGRFFDTESDPLEQEDLAAAGIPEPLRILHATLKTALEPHLEATRKADPIQAAKRKSKDGKTRRKGKAAG